MLVRHALSQLSYAPLSSPHVRFLSLGHAAKVIILNRPTVVNHFTQIFFFFLPSLLQRGQQGLQLLFGIVVDLVAELAGELRLSLLP